MIWFTLRAREHGCYYDYLHHQPRETCLSPASFQAYPSLNKMGMIQVPKSKPGEEGRCVTD